MSLFSVGDRVRVLSADRRASRRALVAIAEDSGLLSVVYESKAEPTEEGDIELDRIEALQPFEDAWESEIEGWDAATLKQHGTVLWQLMDYEAACEYYLKALRKATPRKSVGASAIVRRTSNNMRRATICCVDESDGTADVMYDEDEDEEETVPLKLLLRLAPDADGLQLQCSLLLNLAKCYFKLQKRELAAYYASSVIACYSGPDDEANPLRAKALITRANILRSFRLYQLAIKDATSAAPYAPEAVKLIADLEKERARVKLTDRQLAKELARWLQQVCVFEEDGSIRAVDHEQIALAEKEGSRDEAGQTTTHATVATTTTTTTAAEAKELGYEPGNDSKGWYCSSS